LFHKAAKKQIKSLLYYYKELTKLRRIIIVNIHMEISGKQFTEIGDYVQTHLSDWMKNIKPVEQIPLQLLERMVRVEEETKHLRESMQEGFKRSDENFQAMEKRFDLMEKRFDTMEKRFDTMDQRFESMLKQMDQRFESAQKQMDHRFESAQKQMDQRFESAQKQMEQRFDSMTKRIDRLMIWTFGLAVTTGGVVIAVLK